MDKSSHSEVEGYLMCQRRHYYNYGEKIQSIDMDEKLIRGIVGHACHEAYYKARMNGADHQEAMEPGTTALWDTYEGYKTQLFNPTKFISSLSVLIDHYWAEYEFDKLKVLEVEVLHTVQLTDEFSMPVKMDLIADVPGWGITVIDHKFSYDFASVDKLDLATQLPKYFLAARELDFDVREIALNECRTRETIANKANPSEKFRRTPIPWTIPKIETIMREQMVAAQRITRLKSMNLLDWEQSVLRNPMACNMCDYPEVCIADLNQKDQNLIRAQYYQPKEYR
jgi:CRISPR/Cas system-associated exonuclease Cas4 (RecB family)